MDYHGTLGRGQSRKEIASTIMLIVGGGGTLEREECEVLFRMKIKKVSGLNLIKPTHRNIQTSHIT